MNMNKDVKAFGAAINALEKQETCEDAISRQAVKELYYKDGYIDFHKICELPPVTPQPKVGKWILAQRGRYIDINCSECGHTRVKEFAFGYTVDELNLEETNDWITKNQMNYCEHCGVKMQEVIK